MRKRPSSIVILVITASLILSVACGFAPGGGSPLLSLEEFRGRTREQESRLLSAIEVAAAEAGAGIRPLLPPHPLSEEELRERWLGLSRPNEDGRTPAEQGFTPADLRLPAEGVYTSEYSAEEAYRRYLAAFEAEDVRFDHGCGPQAALDPEGAIVCSFMLQPRGGTDGLSFTIGPEYVTSEGKPARDYPRGPGTLKTRLVTLVRVSGGAPTRERLAESAADEAFLQGVRVMPLGAGFGSPGWSPGLPATAVWAELVVTAPAGTTREKPLEIEGRIAVGGCQRNLSDAPVASGGTPEQIATGKPHTVRLLNNDTPTDACPLVPGRYDLKVSLRMRDSLRFVTVPVELAPAPSDT